MSVDRIRNSIEMIGLIAVVLSLLLVAYEVRQSNRIAQATTTYEIARDVNQFNELGYSDPEFAKLLLHLTNDDSESSAVQSLQARLLANRFVNIWSVQEKAYQNGLITDEQFELTKTDVVTVMNVFPGLKPHWEAVLQSQPRLRDSDVLQPLVSFLSD